MIRSDAVVTSSGPVHSAAPLYSTGDMQIYLFQSPALNDQACFSARFCRFTSKLRLILPYRTPSASLTTQASLP
jgi:hypothetical protein